MPPQSTLETLVQSANGDIRLILGQLQMIRVGAIAVSYDEMKGKLSTSKDMTMSPFTCARELLDSGSVRMKVGERLDLVFQDADMVPLLVQENYLNHRPVIARKFRVRVRVRCACWCRRNA